MSFWLLISIAKVYWEIIICQTGSNGAGIGTKKLHYPKALKTKFLGLFCLIQQGVDMKYIDAYLIPIPPFDFNSGSRD
jgi:hypothetical protein